MMAGDVTHGYLTLTGAELTEHRLRVIEDRLAALEALVIVVDRVTGRVEDHAALFAKLEGRLDERDKGLAKSLDRLHERLDERLSGVAHGTDVAALRTDFTKFAENELREEGALAARKQMWRAWFQITGATVAVLGLIVAGVALFVQ